jgi:hypothetical protein
MAFYALKWHMKVNALQEKNSELFLHIINSYSKISLLQISNSILVGRNLQICSWSA